MPTEANWPLLPDTTESTARKRGSGGLLRPFQRDKKNDFAVGGGNALRSSRIGQVIGTELAELEYDMEFGCRVRDALQRPLDEVTQELARFYIEEAVARWVPDVEITAVVARETAARNGTEIAVKYVPIDARGRRVGVEESVLVEVR